jgi:hypothetical protein
VEGYASLQRGLLDAWHANSWGSAQDHVVVVLPSFSLGATILSHYQARLGPLEHRFLVASLMLRSIPGADLVLVTCADPGDEVIDYYARLAFPDNPERLKERLHLLVVPDNSARGISAKLLDRPDLIERLRAEIDGRLAFIEAWNVTDDEVAVALALGIPVNGTSPVLWPLGFKSAGRRLFREAGVPTPAGCEGVHDAEEVAAAIETIRRSRPRLSQVVVKQDNSGAGDGNWIVPTSSSGRRIPRQRLIQECLRDAPDWFAQDLTAGGIVEEMVRGAEVSSPSAQIDIGADGSVRVLSTHEQVLGGDNGQVFVGCRFPADPAYAGRLAARARSVGGVLAGHGVLGRVAVDFVCVRRRGSWDVLALEINLRRGGTTHPYTVLRHLVPGSYDEQTGRWVAEDGTSRCYRADDNLQHADWPGMSPSTAIQAVEDAGLGFDNATGTGVVLHMLSGLSVDGRIGLTAIGRITAEADALHAAVEPALLRAARSFRTKGLPGPPRGSTSVRNGPVQGAAQQHHARADSR